MNRTASPLLVVSLLGLAACGGSARTDATVPAGADLVVRARPAIEWDQPSYSVTAADGTFEVALINDSSLDHTLHIVNEDGKDVDSAAPKLAIGSGKSVATGTFSLQPGTYKIVCTIPGHNSMKATLTVE